MTPRRSFFKEIQNGLEEIRDHPETLRRTIFGPLDIRKARANFNMSQSEMAVFLNVSVRTLQNWEQGRRGPTGPAQTLLRIMQKEPEAVMRALHS